MKKLELLLISLVFVLGTLALDRYTGMSIAETSQLLQDTENNLKLASKSEFIDTFNLRQDINNALLRLNSYKIELGGLNDTNRAGAIKSEISSLVQNLPKNIETAELVKDRIRLEPEDLEGKFEDFRDLYSLQEGVIVHLEAKLVKLVYFANVTEEKTIIKKDITSLSNITDVYVYELMPSRTIDLDKLIFLVEPKRVENIFRWYSSEIGNKPASFSYVIDGNALNRIYDLKTIVVPKTQQILIKRESFCGDNICTKPFEDKVVCPEDCSKKKGFNIGIIILALIILFSGVFYLNFYRGRLDFRTWLKTPFRNKQDMENVKEFVKKALKKDLDKSKITQALLDRGWTKKQIWFAYEQVEWEERKVLLKIAPSLSDDIKPLYDYIKKCLKYGVEKSDIKARLLMKGWSDKSINEAFSKIN